MGHPKGFEVNIDFKVHKNSFWPQQKTIIVFYHIIILNIIFWFFLNDQLKIFPILLKFSQFYVQRTHFKIAGIVPVNIHDIRSLICNGFSSDLPRQEEQVRDIIFNQIAGCPPCMKGHHGMFVNHVKRHHCTFVNHVKRYTCTVLIIKIIEKCKILKL